MTPVLPLPDTMFRRALAFQKPLHMLVGRVMYQSQSPAETLFRVLRRRPQPPGSRVANHTLGKRGLFLKIGTFLGCSHTTVGTTQEYWVPGKLAHVGAFLGRSHLLRRAFFDCGRVREVHWPSRRQCMAAWRAPLRPRVRRRGCGGQGGAQLSAHQPATLGRRSA